MKIACSPSARLGCLSVCPFFSQWGNVSICKEVRGENRWPVPFTLKFHCNTVTVCWALRRALWQSSFPWFLFESLWCFIQSKSLSPGASPAGSLFPALSLYSAFCPLDTFSLRSHYRLGGDCNVGRQSVSTPPSPTANHSKSMKPFQYPQVYILYTEKAFQSLGWFPKSNIRFIKVILKIQFLFKLLDTSYINHIILFVRLQVLTMIVKVPLINTWSHFINQSN